MEIKELQISNFRGIKTLDWKINSRIVCLVGPGDSTKSTILAAIALLFSPRWNVQISDVDFFNLDVEQPIEISAGLTGFPEEFSKDNRFGLFLNLWNDKDSVHVQEKPGDIPALQVVFRVDKNLEPAWVVRNLDSEEEKTITASDREKLFVAELGYYVGRDLSWGRFSGLTKLTGSKTTQNSSVALSEITRHARKSFSSGDFGDLEKALDDLQSIVTDFGVKPKEELRPGLDPRELIIGAGLITVLDGEIPLNVSGLGTRRLVTMSIYHSLADDGAIFLLDEVETGFEPFRLRKLLNNLKRSTKSQSFMTTHSITPILELADDGLFIVRNDSGSITVCPIDTDIIPYARKIPEAFLSKVIIVCEGKTEWGVLRSVNSYWAEKNGGLDFGTMGVEPSFHEKVGGSSCHKQAELLSSAGFVTALFGDSDRDTNPTFDELRQIGVEVFMWPDNLCIEQRICLDIPYSGLFELMDLALEFNKESEILQQINSALVVHSKNIHNLDELWTIGSEECIRKVLGIAFSTASCFKNNDHSIQLGQLLTKFLDQMVETPTYQTLDQLIRWCYEQSS